jgi:phosphatidylglycerophosphate synthase
VLDERLRTIKVSVLAPVARRFSDTHPLQLTVAAFIIGLMAALAAGVGNYWVALLLWLVNRVLDGLDGEVARLTGKQSDWGGYLDIICDFAVYALVPFALAWSLKSPGALFAIAFLLVTFYVNAGSWLYMSALLEKRQRLYQNSVNDTQSQSNFTSIAIPTGLIEGTETVVFYSLFLIFPTFAPSLMIVMAFLVILTIFQRLSWAESQLQE